MARILLIEPDVVLARNICQALERAGNITDWAKEPQAAITLADSNSPDAVIMDLLLAGRSGVEFLHEFVSYPEWQNTPIILLSSVPETEVNMHGNGYQQFNITSYIYKPHSNLAKIVGAVDGALRVV